MYTTAEIRNYVTKSSHSVYKTHFPDVDGSATYSKYNISSNHEQNKSMYERLGCCQNRSGDNKRPNKINRKIAQIVLTTVIFT